MLLAQVREVRDVEMRLFCGLLRAGLPDVRAEDVAARREHHVRGRVVLPQLVAARLVDRAAHRLVFGGALKWTVQKVQHGLADLLNVDDLEALVL